MGHARFSVRENKINQNKKQALMLVICRRMRALSLRSTFAGCSCPLTPYTFLIMNSFQASNTSDSMYVAYNRRDSLANTLSALRFHEIGGGTAASTMHSSLTCPVSVGC